MAGAQRQEEAAAEPFPCRLLGAELRAAVLGH